MTHPDGVIAMLGGSGAITAHFTSPPFHQREKKDPKVHTVMNTNEMMGGAGTVYDAVDHREIPDQDRRAVCCRAQGARKKRMR